MQIVRQIDQVNAALVGWGVRVFLLSAGAGEGPGRIAERLAGFGGLVEVETDMFAAAEAAQADATGFGLFVMECDAFGGLEAGRRMIAMLGRAAERMPVILVSSEVRVQTFPGDSAGPIELRAPASAVSLRVGFEHALRDRLVYLAA